MINLGAFYTAPEHVREVRNMLSGQAPADAVVFDNACGYGAFLQDLPGAVGCDIDAEALANLRAANLSGTFMHGNALKDVSRGKFGISEAAPLVMVGNPPFNDRTSQIRANMKNAVMNMDDDIRTRDLGISFLLSYDKLRADAVCVLHPLSYLIKPANFALLGRFARNYALRRAKIVSSAAFPDNSQTTAFPIVIALYVRDDKGTTADDIRRFRFTVNRSSFAVSDFEYVDSFLHKYPRRKTTDDLDDVMFYTLRDINALRRNRTFLLSPSANAVFIRRTQLEYYIYADVFKQFACHVPYYLGNSNIMIDHDLFQREKRHFISHAALRHPQLQQHISASSHGAAADKKLAQYFRRLLGKHYENNCAGSPASQNRTLNRRKHGADAPPIVS